MAGDPPTPDPDDKGFFESMWEPTPGPDVAFPTAETEPTEIIEGPPITEIPPELQESPKVEVNWNQIQPGEGVADPPPFTGEEPTVPDVGHPVLPEEHPSEPYEGDLEVGDTDPALPSAEEMSEEMQPAIDAAMAEVAEAEEEAEVLEVVEEVEEIEIFLDLL